MRISSNVIFINHDGGTWAFRNTMSQYQNVVKFGKIEIGEWSFIGAGVIIMPGVTIGKNSVIGAGSIVTKSIPDNSVAVGSPARVLCSIEDYAERCLDKLPAGFDLDKYNANKKQHLMDLYMK